MGLHASFSRFVTTFMVALLPLFEITCNYGANLSLSEVMGPIMGLICHYLEVMGFRAKLHYGLIQSWPSRVSSYDGCYHG